MMEEGDRSPVARSCETPLGVMIFPPSPLSFLFFPRPRLEDPSICHTRRARARARALGAFTSGYSSDQWNWVRNSRGRIRGARERERGGPDKPGVANGGAGSTAEIGEVDYRRHSRGTWKSIPNYRSVFYTRAAAGISFAG